MSYGKSVSVRDWPNKIYLMRNGIFPRSCKSPEAAKRVLARIFKSLRVLEQFPYSGTPLQITGIETGYRSVASGSYRIFYHGDEESVYVVRILYGRRDFMRILFGVTPAPDDEE